MLIKVTVILILEQAAERARKEATGSSQHAGFVENTDEQRKVFIDLLL